MADVLQHIQQKSGMVKQPAQLISGLKVLISSQERHRSKYIAPDAVSDLMVLQTTWMQLSGDSLHTCMPEVTQGQSTWFK